MARETKAGQQFPVQVKLLPYAGSGSLVVLEVAEDVVLDHPQVVALGQGVGLEPAQLAVEGVELPVRVGLVHPLAVHEEDLHLVGKGVMNEGPVATRLGRASNAARASSAGSPSARSASRVASARLPASWSATP